jgi:hypothetical protein
MFVADMNCTYCLVQITSCTGSNPETSMVVSASGNTWFVGSTHTPCIIVVPKRCPGNVACLRILIILDGTGGKVLPGIMILGFSFIGKSRFQGPGIGSTHRNHQMAALILRL